MPKKCEIEVLGRNALRGIRGIRGMKSLATREVHLKF
jgi:hypothetical protein